ncbi:hypothetical protein JHK85_010027 [Glycine max]|nr:hypothetical protein JHK85_010027 [Glycine max]KAG5066033.1 hypothetical protein JHK86_009764 [Glycine max]
MEEKRAEQFASEMLRQKLGELDEVVQTKIVPIQDYVNFTLQLQYLEIILSDLGGWELWIVGQCETQVVKTMIIELRLFIVVPPPLSSPPQPLYTTGIDTSPNDNNHLIVAPDNNV